MRKPARRQNVFDALTRSSGSPMSFASDDVARRSNRMVIAIDNKSDHRTASPSLAVHDSVRDTFETFLWFPSGQTI